MMIFDLSSDSIDVSPLIVIYFYSIDHLFIINENEEILLPSFLLSSSITDKFNRSQRPTKAEYSIMWVEPFIYRLIRGVMGQGVWINLRIPWRRFYLFLYSCSNRLYPLIHLYPYDVSLLISQREVAFIRCSNLLSSFSSLVSSLSPPSLISLNPTITRLLLVYLLVTSHADTSNTSADPMQ